MLSSIFFSCFFNYFRLFEIILSIEGIVKSDKALIIHPYLVDWISFSEISYDIDHTENVVQVMTIHKAKGLEFDCVFLYSCVDSKIPGVNRKPTLSLPKNYSNELSREAHLLESKRLLFVALTRARFLFISTSADNYDGKKAKPSRWINDIGSKFGISLNYTSTTASTTTTSTISNSLSAEVKLKPDDSDDTCCFCYCVYLCSNFIR